LTGKTNKTISEIAPHSLRASQFESPGWSCKWEWF